jgi:amino acid adenylation domain-containing protein
MILAVRASISAGVRRLPGLAGVRRFPASAGTGKPVVSRAMSDLTVFPCLQSDGSIASPSKWLCHTAVVPLPAARALQAKVIVNVAYAILIRAYTGDQEPCYLAADSDDGTTCSRRKFAIPKDFSFDEITRAFAEATNELSDGPPAGPSLLVHVLRTASKEPQQPLAGIPFQLSSRDGNDGSSVELALWYDPQAITSFHADNILQHLVSRINEFAAADQTQAISNSLELSPRDASWIKEINKIPQDLDDCTIHEVISAVAQQQPDATAIEAHDGSLTCAELELRSNNLALTLVKWGVKPGDVVSIVLEKSVWVPVVVLAILKAGASFVLLEPTLPLARLQMMSQKLDVSHAVTSREYAPLAYKLAQRVLVNDGEGDFIPIHNYQPHPASSVDQATLPKVSPQDVAFYMFTSGSSGAPKAVVIQHFAYCSGHVRHDHKYGMSKGVRSLQHHSYSYIAAVLNIFGPLMAGGVVCIPSSNEKSNELAAAIQRLAPDFLTITSSLVKLISPEDVPSLRTVIFAGETTPRAVVDKWTAGGRITVRNGYGQSEGCAMNSTTLLSDGPISPRNIGRGLWIRYWVVDPADHDRLMPVGALGKLLLEGYSIAQGYHGEPEKTASCFIEPPRWAAEFSAGLDGRRWYDTGDLVQYQQDGSLLFFGRSDTQIKFHGMRVQVQEIEHYVAQALREEIRQVVVEKIIQGQDDTREKLVAFIVLRPELIARHSAMHAASPAKFEDGSSSDHQLCERHLREEMYSRLKTVLPLWMIPSEAVLVTTLPKTATGKLDRRSLRDAYQASRSKASQRKVEQLSNGESQTSEEWSSMEQKLRTIWSRVLRVKEALISPNARWVELGGDSITAVALVQAARAAGLSNISTAAVMDGSSIRELGTALASAEPVEERQSSLPTDYSISRALPLTDFQMAYLPKENKTAWVYTYDFSLRGRFELDRLKRALAQLVAHTEILRSRFVKDPNGRVSQYVLSPADGECSSRIQTQEQYDAGDKDVLLHPAVFVLPGLDVTNVGDLKFVLHIHHSIFDGLSLNLLLTDLINFYCNENVAETRPSFYRYLDQQLLRRSDASFTYWRHLLEGSNPSWYLGALSDPSITSPGKNVELTICRMFHLARTKENQAIPVAILAKTAWALTLSCVTADPDVLFMYLMHGRDEHFPNADQIIGCCITEVPMRLQLQNTTTSIELLGLVQQQVRASAPHAHLGSKVIASTCTDWPLRDKWYNYRAFMMHQQGNRIRDWPVGTSGYAHVSNRGYERNAGGALLKIDFDVTTHSTGPSELFLDLRCRGDFYPEPAANAVAEGFAAAIRMLLDRKPWTVEAIRKEILAVPGLPTMPERSSSEQA